MKSERYIEILDKAGAMRAPIGDIPSTGGGAIIQERVRTYTDYHDQLKAWSSEIRIELNNLFKNLRATQTLRRVAFKVALADPAIRSMDCSEAKKREEADLKVSVQDEQIRKLEESKGDLETLALVVDDRLDAVKVSISNLRKEWELNRQQQVAEIADDQMRRRRVAVEEGLNSGVLDIEGSSTGSSVGAESGSAPEPGPVGGDAETLLGQL